MGEKKRVRKYCQEMREGERERETEGGGIGQRLTCGWCRLIKVWEIRGS